MPIVSRNLFVMIFVFGSYQESRYWIKLDGDIFFSLSSLCVVGKRSVLNVFFAEKISEVIEKGQETALIRCLNASNIVVHKDKKKVFACKRSIFSS